MCIICLIKCAEPNIFRYDLLCQEGLSRALRVFEGKAKPPVYKSVKPANGKLEQIRVLESVSNSIILETKRANMLISDSTNSSLHCWCRFAQHHLHPRELCFFH
jgi:hypothetical protein